MSNQDKRIELWANNRFIAVVENIHRIYWKHGPKERMLVGLEADGSFKTFVFCSRVQPVSKTLIKAHI